MYKPATTIIRRVITALAALTLAAGLLAGPAHATGTLDQQAPRNGNSLSNVISSRVSLGQTFTAGLPGSLDQVDLFLARRSQTVAPLTVEIRNVSNGTPGSTILATTIVPASSVEVSDFTYETPPGSFFAVTFASPATVAPGTQYAIVAHTSDDLGYGWAAACCAGYSGGEAFSAIPSNPSDWLPGGLHDEAFRSYVTAPSSSDTTPPSISAPSGVSVDATSPAGAVVNYTVAATDNIDPNPSVSCSPASRSTFAIGDTAVSCTATDASGNSSHASFTVTVKGAPQQIPDQITVIQSYNLEPGTQNSFTTKLDGALKALQAGDTATACSQLNALINHAMAQSGKKLSITQANEIIATATRIRNTIGC